MSTPGSATSKCGHPAGATPRRRADRPAAEAKGDGDEDEAQRELDLDDETEAEDTELARRGLEVSRPDDVIKDPFVLEFLDLPERPALHERDIEQAIIEGLEAFLLEMGKGCCFVGRQKRLTIDGDHFYVDLVFYNRLLRCFVLLDLKLGKLTHQDLGQMMMYVNYFDRTQRAPHEARTVGIGLCSEQNEAMVKITLPEDNDQIVAATYQMYIPTEAELQAELARERDEAERMLRLTAAPLSQPEGSDGGGGGEA